jgi:hypothetical protein
LRPPAAAVEPITKEDEILADDHGPFLDRPR